MKSAFAISLLGSLLLVSACYAGGASDALPLGPLITADIRNLVSAADIHFTGPISKAYFGMPIGTGAMDSLVWNNGSNGLKFQVNRSNVFGYNSAMTGVSGDAFDDGDVTKLSSDFGCGCAFVTVDVGGNPFNAATTQHLSLYDGELTVAGEGVTAEILAGVDADAFVVKIKDSRSAPQAIRVDLTMLQKAGVNKRPPFISRDLAKLGETAESLLAKGSH